MFTLKILITFVVIFSCDAYKSYNKTHYAFLDEWDTIDAKSKDGRVMYSNCSTNEGAVVKNCTVVVEKTACSNDSYVCDISLKSEHAKGNVGKKMKLLGGFGDDKVLFFWQENHKRRGRYFTYGILNMKDCKFTMAKLDKRGVHRKTAVVMYDNSFDVFFKNKTVCGEKICRITFDDQGKVLKEPHSYMEGTLTEKDWILRPLSNKSPDEGHFYVRVEEGNSLVKSNFTTEYYLVKNGNEKLLKRLDGRPNVSISIAHNVITACASYKKNNGYTNCTMFDIKGNTLSEMRLSSNDKKKKKVLSVQNEADGSILVLYRTNESGGEAVSEVTLAKFDLNGKMLRSRIIQDYCGESLNMSEDEEGNYCIVNGCTKEPDNMWGDKEMSFTYQCFNDYDLF